MNKRQLASWLVAGTLVVGGGIALAENGPDDPSVSVDETTTTLESTTTTVDETTTTTAVEVTTTTVADDAEAGEHPDNHGAVVSQAAHRHDMDEACGNHGRWVSSVAKGEEQCAAVAEADEADEDGDEAVETESDDDGGGDDDDVADAAETADGHGGGANRGHGSKG